MASLDRLAAAFIAERFQERASWAEAAVAFVATPVVLIWFRESVPVLVTVTMWTWLRGAITSGLTARAGRRADPEDPL